MQRKDEIILFGGELWNRSTDKVSMYSGVFTYNTAKGQWSEIKSKGPHPRSACCGAVHKGHLYIFGGEFTSPNQEKFKHFRCGLQLFLLLYSLLCCRSSELQSTLAPDCLIMRCSQSVCSHTHSVLKCAHNDQVQRAGHLDTFHQER